MGNRTYLRSSESDSETLMELPFGDEDTAEVAVERFGVIADSENIADEEDEEDEEGEEGEDDTDEEPSEHDDGMMNISFSGV